MTVALDQAVADPQQTIAELRRQLDERTAERDEALAQHTATAEVLQAINSSPGNLTPVFEAMLEKALRLCNAAYGDLLSYDGELFHVAAIVHEDSRVGESYRRRPPFAPPPSGLLRSILNGEEIVYVEDLQDLGYGPAPQFRELVDSGGYRSLLNVALRKEGTLLGVISILRKEVRPFSDKQIALLQNFAALPQADPADRRQHPGLRLQRADPGRHRTQGDRRPRPAARLRSPGPQGGADHQPRTSQRSAGSRLHDRR
jgi:transcriptional regulator with GAF, ATPase, and Fis domain